MPTSFPEKLPFLIDTSETAKTPEGPEGKRDMVIWRLTTVIICLAWLVCFSIRVFVLGISDRAENMLSPPLFIAFHFGLAALLIVWIVYPREFYFPALFCWLWGLTQIIDGGSLDATALHVFGYLFALKRGYFRTHTSIKLVIAAVILIAALVSQIRYSEILLIRHGLQVLEFALIATAVVLVFYADLQQLLRQQADTAPPAGAVTLFLRLDQEWCNEQELAILQKILAGGKYASIAHEYGIAVSTLKRRVHTLYAAIGVLDRADFIVRYSRYTLELLPSPVTPPPEETVPDAPPNDGDTVN